MTEASVRVSGTVAPGFEPVRDAFEANFDRYGEVGAGCCVYLHGRLVVDLVGGSFGTESDRPYTDRTLQLVASATKGALAISALRLVERGELDLDVPVAEYWPEFAAAGKADLPVRWLFDHRAGLVGLDEPLTMPQIYAWRPVVDALAAQRPLWTPGTEHGYHALTYGWLVGEVLARITGRTPGRLLTEEIADPLGIEFWVGLPESEMDRVAPMIPAPLPESGPDPFVLRLLDSTSLAHKAFFIREGLLGAINAPALLAAQLPAANGVTTARGLARMYAAVLGEVDGVRLLAPETVSAVSRSGNQGSDLVTGFASRFSVGFMLSFPERPMAGPGSFGHYGMGGSVGFAHPESGLAFGYVVNQMLPSGVVDPRSAALVAAALRCR